MVNHALALAIPPGHAVVRVSELDDLRDIRDDAKEYLLMHEDDCDCDPDAGMCAMHALLRRMGWEPE